MFLAEDKMVEKSPTDCRCDLSHIQALEYLKYFGQDQ